MIKNILFVDNLYQVFESIRDQGYSFFSSLYMMELNNSFHFFKTLSLYFLYPLFSLPYALMNINSNKEWYKVLLVFPFSIFYMPVYSVISVIGILKGIKDFYTIKKDQRGW